MPPISAISAPVRCIPNAQPTSGIIDFKTAAEKGIMAGQIKTIIHPALADHVREAVRFKDELVRAA